MVELPTNSETAQYVTFRCSCGGELRVPANGDGACDQCGRHISLHGLGTSMTVSICHDQDSGESFQTLDHTDRSGEELGHFRLISKIGFGGMGSVYRALDESLQRFVAVKVMRGQDEGGESSVKEINRLLDEAVAQARLNHPNIVTIYYVGRKDVEPFLAMELLPGPTLSTLIRQGPLPYGEIVHYAQQIVSALAHASNMGLVHGDIKPGNLILAGEQTVKLSDFGLAKSKHAELTEGISGTLSYMAPELTEGASPTDQTDMYSLGVTLFEITFGKRPYVLKGNTPSEQLSNREGASIDFPAKLPKSVPRQWLEVLQRLMAYNPVDRFQDYKSLQKQLRRVAPVGLTSAGLLNRSLAWLVDLGLPMLIMIPMILPGMLADQSTIGGVLLADWVLQLADQFRLFGLFSPLVPLVVTYFEWRGWSTVGHYLFQLRLVDEHGLRLDRSRRLVRCLLRNAPIWIFSLTSVLDTLGSSLMATIVAPIDDIIVLLNTVPVLGRKRLAMHDRLVSSRVVLDTRVNH